MSTAPAKLRTDLLWSYCGFGVVAASGAGVNLVLSVLYGAEVLGSFNQVFAFYIVGSQLGALGVHYSVLRYLSHRPRGRSRSALILNSALLPVGVLSAAVTVVFGLAAGAIGKLLGSPSVSEGLLYSLPGIFLFPINKVLLGALNGRRQIRVLSLCQVLRGLLLVGWVVVPYFSTLPLGWVTAAFSVAEVGVFLLAWFPSDLGRSPLVFATSRAWIRRHVDFGVKGFLSGTIVELNSRVDVLLLGYFLADREVGIYSFAAMFAEGLYQLLVVLKTNLNPLLADMLRRKDFDGIQRLVRATRRRAYPLMAIASLAVVLTFPLLLRGFANGHEFGPAWPALAALCTAILFAAGFLPFDSLLIQGGLPGRQSLLSAYICLTNGVLNLFLIPQLGITGAAVATGTALIAGNWYLHLMTQRHLGVPLMGCSRTLAGESP